MQKNLVSCETVVSFMPLVKTLANSVYRKMAANVELDDLVQYGAMGLIDALNKYDKNKCDEIRPYLLIRIKGAIYDGIRSDSWFPRGREKDYSLIGFENQVSPGFDDFSAPHSEIAHCKDIIDKIVKMTDKLTPKEKTVMLSYLDGFDQKEIGEEMGISCDGVSFHYRNARDKIRKYLREVL